MLKLLTMLRPDTQSVIVTVMLYVAIGILLIVLLPWPGDDQ